MAGNRAYYDLVASLPPLPYFEKAERNPINPERLRGRLRMLERDDRKTVDRAGEFIALHRQPVGRTDAEVVWMAQRFIDSTSSPALLRLVKYRMDMRTVMAALRRKNKGMEAPLLGEKWGVGEWVTVIEKNWQDPDLKLASVFEWIPQARQLLEAGDALGLDRLLFSEEWRWVDSLGYGSEFSFDAVLAYLFQWDVLDHWLSYDAAAAEKRFEELVVEVTGEHYELFD
jgi:uncharacterized protein DUF2764